MVRNDGQGTSQRNYLIRQETDDALYMWHYNGSTWSVPMYLHKGDTGVQNNLGITYGNSIVVSPESYITVRVWWGRLLYSNLPPPLRGMNSINLIVYGDRTGGTCDFYRMGHDWSFGGTRMK